MLLEEAGYQVRVCADGEQGLEVFSSTQVDLVILDYSLPALNGAEVAGAMRSLKPGVPIVMVAGHPECPHDVDGQVDVYMAKSSGAKELLKEIERLLGMTTVEENRLGAG